MMFSKYQGLGNDFIIVDQRNNPRAATLDLSSARDICDRRRGIGGDGLIVLLDGSHGCQYTMRIINADGSEAEMCGNGIRCLAMFVKDDINIHKSNVENNEKRITCSFSTLAGKIVTEITPEGDVIVDMGEPTLYPWSNALRQTSSTCKCNAEINTPLSIQLKHGKYNVTDISMGNPHAVVFVDNLEAFVSGPFHDEGPMLSTYYDIFPSGSNAEFVQVLSPTHLRLEVWERGSGHTQACGTGACAAVVAAARGDHISPNEWCRVTLLGGDLEIRWQTESNHVYMRGPGVKVFSGESKILQTLFS